METKDILNERQHTHGSFFLNSRISQEFKRIFEIHMEGKSFSPEMREALDMIFHKISRIAAGNPYEADHWADIAGYAELVVKSLEEVEVPFNNSRIFNTARDMMINQTNN